MAARGLCYRRCRTRTQDGASSDVCSCIAWAAASSLKVSMSKVNEHEVFIPNIGQRMQRPLSESCSSCALASQRTRTTRCCADGWTFTWGSAWTGSFCTLTKGQRGRQRTSRIMYLGATAAPESSADTPQKKKSAAMEKTASTRAKAEEGTECPKGEVHFGRALGQVVLRPALEFRISLRYPFCQAHSFPQSSCLHL